MAPAALWRISQCLHLEIPDFAEKYQQIRFKPEVITLKNPIQDNMTRKTEFLSLICVKCCNLCAHAHSDVCISAHARSSPESQHCAIADSRDLWHWKQREKTTPPQVTHSPSLLISLSLLLFRAWQREHVH